MPIMQPLPELSSIDAPFIDLIIAFFGQVLHVPSPGHLVIRELQIVSNTPVSALMRKVMLPEYAVTIVLDTPLPSIGNKIFLDIDSMGAISKLYFEPGWKPTI